MLKFIRALALVALMSAAGSFAARAEVLVWNVTGMFSAEGPDAQSLFLSGTISYDTVMGDLSDWDLHTFYEDYTSAGDDSQTPNGAGSVVMSAPNEYQLVGENGISVLHLVFDFGLDATDLSFVAMAFNEGSEAVDPSPTWTIASGSASRELTDVPEPASVALLGTGILLLGAGIRRRFRG